MTVPRRRHIEATIQQSIPKDFSLIITAKVSGE
jgi:hypothetical protein